MKNNVPKYSTKCLQELCGISHAATHTCHYVCCWCVQTHFYFSVERSTVFLFTMVMLTLVSLTLEMKWVAMGGGMAYGCKAVATRGSVFLILVAVNFGLNSTSARYCELGSFFWKFVRCHLTVGPSGRRLAHVLVYIEQKCYSSKWCKLHTCTWCLHFMLLMCAEV